MHPVDRKYLISHSFTVSHIVFINKFYGSHAVTLIDALNVSPLKQLNYRSNTPIIPWESLVFFPVLCQNRSKCSFKNLMVKLRPTS